MLPKLIKRYDKKSFHFWTSSKTKDQLKFYRLSDDTFYDHINSIYQFIKKKKGKEYHNHKPQHIPDTKRKRKLTKPNKRKSNKRTENNKINLPCRIKKMYIFEKYGAFNFFCSILCVFVMLLYAFYINSIKSYSLCYKSEWATRISKLFEPNIPNNVKSQELEVLSINNS